MKTPFTKSKRGFTIIEVSLVLAIGGLIMLMVFIAWPAVQRNQNDSRRKSSDLTRLFSALTSYTTNNNGRLPANSSALEDQAASILVTGDETKAGGENPNAWEKFYNNYLLAQGDTFVDPVGTPYSLAIMTCSGQGTSSAPNKGLNTGEACTNTTAKAAGTEAQLFTNTDKNGQSTVEATFDDQASTISIVIGARCDGENITAATSQTGGNRKFAILYKLEGGGVYCENN